MENQQPNNSVFLMGEITSPVILKTARNKAKYCSFSIKTVHHYEVDGEEKTADEYHNIRAWGPIAMTCKKKFKEGVQAKIKGRLRTVKYEEEGMPDKYYTAIHPENVALLN
jgi:single stranded DNA-binding protein